MHDRKCLSTWHNPLNEDQSPWLLSPWRQPCCQLGLTCDSLGSTKTSHKRAQTITKIADIACMSFSSTFYLKFIHIYKKLMRKGCLFGEGNLRVFNVLNDNMENSCFRLFFIVDPASPICYCGHFVLKIAWNLQINWTERIRQGGDDALKKRFFATWLNTKVRMFKKSQLFAVAAREWSFP